MTTTNINTALDAQLVNVMLESVLAVLSTMAATDARLSSAKPSSEYVPTGDVSSIIGITGEAGEGTIILSFTQQVAALLVSRLVGLNPEDLSKDELLDGVGELINMVSGRSKTALSSTVETPYKLSLPSLVVGHNHEVVTPGRTAPFL
jgi:chemotaxis protein CheX